MGEEGIDEISWKWEKRNRNVIDYEFEYKIQQSSK